MRTRSLPVQDMIRKNVSLAFLLNGFRNIILVVSEMDPDSEFSAHLPR